MTRRRRCMEDKDEGHGDSKNVINGDKAPIVRSLKGASLAFTFVLLSFLPWNTLIFLLTGAIGFRRRLSLH